MKESSVEIGASSFEVIVIVFVLVTCRAPPAPWDPELPSLKVHCSDTDAGGYSLELLYAICCIAELTSAFVALALNVIDSVPLPFV